MSSSSSDDRSPRFGCLAVFGFVIIGVVVSVGATLWFVQSSFSPKPFEPVTLAQNESRVLSQKLDSVGLGQLAVVSARASGVNPANNPQTLSPQAYREDASKRQISLTERELNALIESRTGRGEQLVIDLSEDLASAQLLFPLDPDFPFLGGKTLKLSSGLGVSMDQGRPKLVLKGVSLWGIPLPDAWLGGLKHQDLAANLGGDELGLWQQFAAGIERIKVTEGAVQVMLKE